MKKLTSFLCLLVLVITTSTPAFAQYTTPAPTRPSNSREQFQLKLQTIRDEKKKAILERLDKLIAEINLNRTNIMTRHLVKIEEILNRIESRALEVEAGGKDISSVKTAITSARTAIASSKATVTTQAAKIYTINITTESNLGQAVSAIRITFAKDLQATHQTVVTARKAVRTVLSELAKIVGEKLTSTTEK